MTELKPGWLQRQANSTSVDQCALCGANASEVQGSVACAMSDVTPPAKERVDDRADDPAVEMVAQAVHMAMRWALKNPCKGEPPEWQGGNSFAEERARSEAGNIVAYLAARPKQQRGHGTDKPGARQPDELGDERWIDKAELILAAEAKTDGSYLINPRHCLRQVLAACRPKREVVEMCSHDWVFLGTTGHGTNPDFYKCAKCEATRWE